MSVKLVTVLFGAMLLAATPASAIESAGIDTKTTAITQNSQAHSLPGTTPLVTFGVSLLLGSMAIVSHSTKH